MRDFDREYASGMMARLSFVLIFNFIIIKSGNEVSLYGLFFVWIIISFFMFLPSRTGRKGLPFTLENIAWALKENLIRLILSCCVFSV
jgi:hypothetical protein